ncbi:MAG: hypothetical protein ACRD96_03285 [Bryobacteraceae bacterium]
MKLTSAVLLAFLAAAQPGPGEDARRFAEIQNKRARGEQLTPEDLEFQKQLAARRNAEYVKANPPRESTGLVPLTEMGGKTYKAESGGLYGGGSNTPPAAHRDAGVRIARGIRPIEGKVVLLTIGMSNTTQESQAFVKLAAADPDRNPELTIVDGAQGGQAADTTANPRAKFWQVVEERLQAAGVTSRQVQAVWLKQAIIAPSQPFPAEARRLEGYLTATLHNLHDRYPNLKIAYLSSRIYAGYARSALNPEPHAYESGFAVRWVVNDQIAGRPELNYDPARGPVRAPWIAWGPYLWADGTSARQDGFVWTNDDLAADGTHPSMPGREKVAKLLLEFFKKDATTRAWFQR